MRKGPWTEAEDAILLEYVKKHGERNWNAVQKNMGLQRCGKSCRLRWTNHLSPNLKKGSFTTEEENLIIQLHAEFGNKWARISTHLPGRTDNEIKNYWNTRIKRRQRAGLLPDPPAIKPWQTPLSSFNSATPPFSQNSNGSFLQDPDRGKNISFQISNFTSPAQYVLRNVDHGSAPPLSCLMLMELPSSQFSSNSSGELFQSPQGNSGLLDALLQKSYDVGEFLNSKLGYSDCSLGIQVKEEVVEMANQDLSTLLDMMPTETTVPMPMTMLSGWYNNSSSGGEFSNGPSSVLTTDDEIGLEMQRLPMTQVELDWGLGCCSGDNMQWVNMPRIY